MLLEKFDNQRLRFKRPVSARTGDATPTDVVDAETALTRAQQSYYQALYDYLTALARIDYAMGTTWVACPTGH